MKPISYARHHHPPAVIQHAVWLYLRFNLSLRDAEDLLAERGLDISYETVRRWVAKFGPAYARRLRSMRPKADRRWHLDEMFVSIGGRMMYLWRAVDAEGEVLDILVQRRRNKRAAAKLIRRLLKRQGCMPGAIVTDKLRSYGAALGEVGLRHLHVTGGRLNNRAEVSHQPVRRRERSWIGFKQPGTTQRFLSAHAAVYNTFNLQRHLISRRTLRVFREAAFTQWTAAVAAA
ncbi:MAG: IS6 family transposase [Alphaproteobacteria bacterium]